MTFMYAAALLTFAVAFGWGSRWLITVMVDSRFSAARSFTFLLCMGFWFSGLWKLLGCYLIAAGNTKIYGLITSATAIFHIGLTLYLLRHIGIIGAAWATMLSFAVATITTFIIAARLRPMPWLSALKC
jgi:O-antigen/teichoic acid export membrane protein